MNRSLRGTAHRLAVLAVATLAAASCDEASNQAILEIGAVGQVQGFLFIDLNGTGVAEFSDDGVEGWELRLEQPGGGVIASTVTDTAGNFQFPDVPVGQMVLTLDPAQLGDTLLSFGVAFDPFTLGAAEQVLLQPGVTYPTMAVEEVRDLGVDVPVFTTGIALNSLSQTIRDLHLKGVEEAVRVTGLLASNIITGDTVRVFGRTSRDLGQPILRDGQVFFLGTAATILVPLEVTTAAADLAEDGSLDAELVQVRNAEVLEVEDQDEDGIRVVIDDGSGPLEIRLRAFLNQDLEEIQADSTTFLRARGVLVPRDDGGDIRWTLLPRTSSDYRIENPEPPPPPPGPPGSSGAVDGPPQLAAHGPRNTQMFIWAGLADALRGNDLAGEGRSGPELAAQK